MPRLCVIIRPQVKLADMTYRKRSGRKASRVLDACIIQQPGRKSVHYGICRHISDACDRITPVFQEESHYRGGSAFIAYAGEYAGYDVGRAYQKRTRIRITRQLIDPFPAEFKQADGYSRCI